MNLQGKSGVIHSPRKGTVVRGHVVPRCYGGVPRKITESTWQSTEQDITCGNCIDLRAADTLKSLKPASGGRRPSVVAATTKPAKRCAYCEDSTCSRCQKEAVVPLTKPAKNGVAEDAARVKAEKIMVEIIDKIIAARGQDDVGEGDDWASERREGVDDYTYDMAVEVRKLRAAGAAWWRIASDLYLPGYGASAAQGKSGAAYARRLWERAWGRTYTDGERAPRETKERKRERALVVEARPYFSSDALDASIVQTICGQTIHWNARLGDRHGGMIIAPQEAIVHHDPRTIRVSVGPKGRYVEFYEQIDASMLSLDPHRAIAKTGPRRAVYLHLIERVGR